MQTESALCYWFILGGWIYFRSYPKPQRKLDIS